MACWGGILRLPTSLEVLSIQNISGLTSLESVSEEPPSLVSLLLRSCGTLASLPNKPQAYNSIQELEIKGCPAIKDLPRCLQQQLGSINNKRLDAQYEVTEFRPFKPKTWKEMPKLVHEWRQAYRD